MVYYFLPGKKQNILLLAASYIFYSSISIQFSAILMVMTIINYFIGNKLGEGSGNTIWLKAGIGFNLLFLLFFKTANFYIQEVVSLLNHLGFNMQTKGLSILLPIGLSFYSLQAISYLLDVSRKQTPVCSNPINFALYLAYFPKMTAGPIERANTFLPQLKKQRIVDNDLLSESFALIVIGLVRKVVIADTLIGAVPLKVLSSNPSQISFLAYTIWLLIYGVGIYNDFCGYTNIVRGISGFFGIKLSRNFKHPLFSRNFSEFWNRWHITFSSWLRDYIYFPLGRFLVRRSGGKTTFWVLTLPPMMTMIASGLWHRFNLSYLSWGFVMGFILVGERLASFRKPIIPPDKKPLLRQILSNVFIVSVGVIALAFIVLSPRSIPHYFMGIFVPSQWTLPVPRIAIMLIPSLFIDIAQYHSQNEFIFLKYTMPVRVLLLSLALLVIFLFSQNRIPSPFIYQGF